MRLVKPRDTANSKRHHILVGSLIIASGLMLFNGESSIEASTHASRSTELGKAKVKQRKDGIDLSVVNDPAIAKNWGITGKFTDAQKAWARHKNLGSRDIRVAVIDTGIDIQHPDIQNNLWVNKGEVGTDSKGRDKSTNGVDDDGNGFIDDLHGWNFVAESNSLKDNHGHGTHIAGIVGAEGGNGVGISGVSPKVSLMILKYYDPKAPGTNNLVNTVRAIEYAVKMKAHIINYSGGGLQQSAQEKAAIEKAQKNNILFVAAAGNERSNSDKNPYYPADYDLDNIISVTAINQSKNVLETSNYGTNTVDIAAPGQNIYSTLPGGNYGNMTGTSQATAFVSGVAALIMAKYRDFKPSQVIRHINTTGDYEPDRLQGKTRYKKRLNAYRAMAILDQGINANGSVTENTGNMKPGTFSYDRQRIPSQAQDQTASTISAGRDLMKAMDKMVNPINVLTDATVPSNRNVQGKDN